jgi:type I restriction enzyme S subunit
MTQQQGGETTTPARFGQPWIDVRLGDVSRVKTGAKNNQDKDSLGRYPFFVRSAEVERIDSYTYDCEAILVPGEGGIGSIFHFVTGKFEVHQRVYKISDFSEAVLGKFVYYYMRQYFGAHATEQRVKATVDSLRLPTFLDFHLKVPSLYEQQEIVDALDDADEHIAALERVIAKKEAIKQGMMQQLLTGKTRLPGFTESWREVRLGEVAHIKTGSRNNQDNRPGGRYPFFVRSSEVERIDSYSYDCEAILVPGEGGIGSIFHYVDGKFEVHQRVYKISDFASDISGRFVYYYLQQFFGAHATAHSVKATVDSLRLPTFQVFRMFVPAQPEEQRAVASALADADAELDALRARLAKARAVKQGMMQQLLTGRVRLPVREDAA